VLVLQLGVGVFMNLRSGKGSFASAGEKDREAFSGPGGAGVSFMDVSQRPICGALDDSLCCLF
jgi:hypothetical protein